MTVRTFIVTVDVEADRMPAPDTERSAELRREVWDEIESLVVWLDGEPHNRFTLHVASIMDPQTDREAEPS